MSDSGTIVYIVEDDVSFRKSLERLLRASGFEFISCESATAFLMQSRLSRPACLLLDVMLPDMDGLRLQQEILARGISLPIVFISGHGNIPMSVQAMKQGSVDFLPKPFDAGTLKDAIIRALERDKENRNKEVQINRAKALIETLTPREKEVLCWVISGRLNKQIARALGTTEKTIKVHRGRVMEKTGVTSVAALVRLAELADISPAP